MSGWTDRNMDSFKNFVDRLLKPHDQVRLDCFRLSHEICSWNDGDHDFDISGWICAALCRGVKEIELQLSYLDDILPAVLFTCRSLVTLKLDAVGHKFKFPSDVCLGNLKTLHFRDSFFGDSIHRLISNCHVLEDMAFIECDFYNISKINIQIPSLKRLILDFDLGESGGLNYVVVINAPNLVYFQYTDVVAKGYTLSTMKSLEKAHITICGCDTIDSQTIATHLIQGICNMRSLHLTINEEVVAGTQWKALEVPSCLSFHLKEIEISSFNTHMIEMVSYFLDNAMILEKLIISMDALTVTQEKKTRNQLLQLVKSSKKCLKLVVIL
ncbi:F-box/LRR-repeat protein At4g14103-like [Gossypium arboreum]|uniref:F-box/LRR-repeat protein At4g14103-like n=1 Tax=Gossypium arboreum TaxID=29729 RepID=UPI0022F169CC|nr:F-box/LRR-repeat protein At4g14103-like [Gossypium arboreum]